jgi:hypothetical protein
MPALHDGGANDDVSCLNIELELILERLLNYIIFFLNGFYFKDWLKYMNLELDLEKLLEMLLLPSSMRIFGSV